jgi:hypothetical protein
MFAVDTETGSHSALAIDQQIHLALADPAVRALNLGEEVLPSEQQTPETLGALVKADAEKWWPIMEAGIKPRVSDVVTDLRNTADICLSLICQPNVTSAFISAALDVGKFR